MLTFHQSFIRALAKVGFGVLFCIAGISAAIATPLKFVESVNERLEAPFDQNDSNRFLYQPSAMVTSTSGEHVYVAASGDDAITFFLRDATSGQLIQGTVVRQGEAGVDGLIGVADIAISPDGKFLFAIGAAADARPVLSVFRRDISVGLLSFHRSVYSDVSNTDPTKQFSLSAVNARIQLSADGKNLHVIGWGAHELIVFSLGDDGSLDFIQSFDGVRDGTRMLDAIVEPVDIAIRPDGLSVYLVANASTVQTSSLITFTRDASSGLLRLEDVITNGVTQHPDPTVTPPPKEPPPPLPETVEGLGEPSAIIISADGRNVYVASRGDDALVVFRRNPDGLLRILAVLRGNELLPDTEQAFGFATLALGYSDRFVYAGSASGGRLAAFSRDQNNGRLSFIGLANTGADSAAAMGDIVALSVPNDGQYIYAASTVKVNGVTQFDSGANLGLVVKSGSATVMSGSEILTSLIVTNSSDVVASNVIARVVLPAGVTFKSTRADSDAATCSVDEKSTIVTCSLLLLNPKASLSIDVLTGAPIEAATLRFQGSAEADQYDDTENNLDETLVEVINPNAVSTPGVIPDAPRQNAEPSRDGGAVWALLLLAAFSMLRQRRASDSRAGASKI